MSLSPPRPAPLMARLALVAAVALAGPAPPAPTRGGAPAVPEPIAIGDALVLLLDDDLIDAVSGLQFVLHEPRREEVVLRFDAPWEGPTSAYVTVFADDGRYRMYYRGSGNASGEEVTCYAESEDGIHWTRPSLGLFEFPAGAEGAGAKTVSRGGMAAARSDNNIVWRGRASHNFTPFLDANPHAAPQQRYKALGYGPGRSLQALVSGDGIHWELLREEPVLTEGAFDSQNLAFWDTVQGQYVCYFRIFSEGVRAIARSTSPDFVTWSPPEPIELIDATTGRPAPAEHLYTNATTPYFRNPSWYLAFPKRFVPDRQAVAGHPESGVSDAVFLFSRDGLHFSRYMEAFLRPGRDPENWTDRSNMVAWGILPTGGTAPLTLPSPRGRAGWGEGDEMSIYFSQHYRHPTAHLRRGVLRTDGFVSLQAAYAGGEFTTRALTFSEARLVINAATSAAGSVRVELQEADGTPIKGYTLDDCREFFGDRIAHTMHWTGGNDLSHLAGRPVRLRFVLRDADLYSFRFAPFLE